MTSRTVVADRVRIAPTSKVVKLEGFDDGQIANWLGVWRDHNRDAIETGNMGELTLDAALGVRDLSCQPLLLLMLALYAADPRAEQLGPRLSGAAFYGRILTSFVEREVTKTDSTPDDSIPEDLVEDQMWRLGITAYSMFNRDRLYIRDDELGADLIALTGSQIIDSNTANIQARTGQETISRFFFVYAAEADTHRQDEARRAFEFLHATFGEYLVAHFCVKIMVETISRSRSSWQGGREFDDDLLFALLSHQTLTTRRTTVTFIRELFAQLDPGSRRRCSAALTRMLAVYRSRLGTVTYSGYRPLPVDHVREMASFSANLALLKVLISEQGSVALADMTPPGQAHDWWLSTVSLWRHALGESGWELLCRTIEMTPNDDVIFRSNESPAAGLEPGLLRFTKNKDDLVTYHVGSAALGQLSRADLVPVMMSLVSYLVYATNKSEFVIDSVRAEYLTAARKIRKADITDGALLYRAILDYLDAWRQRIPFEEARDWIKLALRGGQGADRSSLAFYVARYPRLLNDIPELVSPDAYRQPWVPAVLYAAELGLAEHDVEKTPWCR